MRQFSGKWLPTMEDKQSVYEKVCIEIAQDLTSFKRNPVYCRFIGNDMRDEKTAINFYRHIEKEYPFLLDESNVAKFQKNDEIGNPNLYSIQNNVMSPGTLRFMKVVGDCLNLTNEIKSIVEIGSGYGGQCLVFKQYKKDIEYTLLDIPSSLLVSKKYLKSNGCNAVFMPSDNIETKKYDLCISDYCLSEFDIKGVRFYINEVIQYCSNAYITTNSLGISLGDLIKELDKVFDTIKVQAENPKTSEHINFIITCKDNKKI